MKSARTRSDNGSEKSNQAVQDQSKEQCIRKPSFPMKASTQNEFQPTRTETKSRTGIRIHVYISSPIKTITGTKYGQYLV